MKKRGFTLIELMVVVVIIGILAAIAIPNFVKVIARAKEASVKENMHTLQTTIESISIDSLGVYCQTVGVISGELPRNFKNPFTNATGEGNTGAWDLVTTGTGATGNEGVSTYESDGSGYTIYGAGKDGDVLNLTLRPGQ